MRIGFLTCGDMNALSGGYLYNRKFLAYLQQQGDQVEVISFPMRSYWRQISDNFDRYWLNRLVNLQVDILIQDELVHPSVFRLNRLISAQVRFPIIALVHLLTAFDHHPFYNNWMYRIIERCYLHSVEGLILNSQCTLQQTKELIDDRLPSYTVAVPAGDNFSTIQKSGVLLTKEERMTGPLKVLFVGNVIRRKGLHVMIEALHRLPDRDFRLVVAGRLDMEPAYVKRILKRIDKYRLQDVITIAGPVEGDKLLQLYQAHDLFVLPSAYEGYGIVYVEAQQFGLPVIGTTSGAASEIIMHGENGYLIPPGDSTALAEILAQLQRDRQWLLTMGQNAREAFKRHPSWDDTGHVIREFLLKLAAQGATG